MSRELPIIFNTEMVKAILDGRKVCTRRPLKPQPINTPDGAYIDPYNKDEGKFTAWTEDHKMLLNCGGNIKNTAHWKPPYQTGDLLYVRETFKLGAVRYLDNRLTMMCLADGLQAKLDKSKHPLRSETLYPVDMEKHERVRPSIHMPKWASRIWLKVTGVRVERVNEITEEEALKEGIFFAGTLYRGAIKNNGCRQGYSNPINAFKDLWNSLYKNWDSNPWVWVIDFEVVKR